MFYFRELFLYVVDNAELKALAELLQVVHEVDGTQSQDDPVSMMKVICFDIEPMYRVSEYCIS